MTLNTECATRYPVRNKVALAGRARSSIGQFKYLLPEIATEGPVLNRLLCKPGGHVSSNRMSFVSVYAPFSLLQVNRISGQIPVNYPMAPGVKIKPFLSHRGTR